MDADKPSQGGWSAIAPLRERTFRTIWSASVLSNFGQLILGVGAAWEMTRLANSPDMVALVQAAMMLPLMLVSVPAGAFADMFDRRTIAMTGLGFATLSAAILTGLAAAGLITPAILLIFCALIGVGVALYGPAWQASIREQVEPEHLPAAIALGSISYNLARSFGPAIGGLIVLAAGATAAFAINAIFYLPLLAAFYFWRRERPPSRLAPERIDRAIISGVRYALHSPPVRTVMLRAFVTGLASAAAIALAPVVAKDLLHGDAGTYGLLLGATGVGAVGGALISSRVREHLKPEMGVRLGAVVGGAAILAIGFSHNLLLTAVLSAISGATNMLTITLLNVGIQLSVPRWVTARALSLFLSALSGGVAIGAWIWGKTAGEFGVADAFIFSGAALMASPLIGLLFPMPNVSEANLEPVELGEMSDVALALTSRSGPIVVEIDYRIEPGDARQFYNVMMDVQRTRQRNGAFDWSLARDIGDPAVWTERYHVPTWNDYLHQRSRFTQSDQELVASARAMSAGIKVRRRLERPFGSVRWRPETPDPHRAVIDPFTPP